MRRLLDGRDALSLLDAGQLGSHHIDAIARSVLLAEGVDPTKDTIGGFAGQMLQTIPVSDGIRDVTEKMHKHGVRRLPVVDSEGQLAGIVSLDDILLLLGREMGDIAAPIETELTKERSISALRSRSAD